MTQPLIDSRDAAVWIRWRQAYSSAIRLVASNKFKSPVSGEKFLNLHRYYAEGGGYAAPLTHKKLIKVVEYKLHRGTFRPGLLQKAQSNEASKVDEAWSKAKELLEQPLTPAADTDKSKGKKQSDPPGAAAIKEMDKALFGVGPATAAMLLAPLYPKHVCCMSDEVMLSCGGLFGSDPNKLKYDLKTFKMLTGKLGEVAVALNKRSTSRNKPEGLTLDDLEKALYSWHIYTVRYPDETPPAAAKAMSSSASSTKGTTAKLLSPSSSKGPAKRPASSTKDGRSSPKCQKLPV